MERWSLVIIFCLILFVGASRVSLADPVGIYVGGGVGLVLPSESDYQNRLGFGAEAGIRFPFGLGVGGYFLTSSKDVTTGMFSVSTRIQSYGGELSYFFDISPFVVGAGLRAGGSELTTEVLGANTTAQPFCFGPVASVAFKLSPLLTVGVETNESFFLKADTNVGVRTSSFQTLNAMASVKLWI